MCWFQSFVDSRSSVTDPLHILGVREMEPLEKLDLIEAERIIAILEDSTEKLNFLDRITPDVLQHRDELSKFIGDEIARTMNEQKYLEKRYEELIEHRSSMKGMVNKTKYKEVQEEIQDVSRALRESTNNLVRNLKENPNVSGNLIKVQRDRVELNDLLLRCIQELRDRGTFYTITSKVDEENNSRQKFQLLKLREKELRETVFKLEKQLNEEQTLFHRTVNDQKLAINRLKDELSLVKGSTLIDSKFKRKESLAYVSAIWRECKLKERVLEDRVKELEDRLHTESVVHNDTKEFLIRKHQNINDDLAKWEEKYDENVAEMDQKIGEITDRRKALLDKLCVLQARKQTEIETEMKEKAQREHEMKVKKMKDAEQKKRNYAAKVLQQGLRSYIKRCRELEAIKGDGKKKKAAGKKGKKK
jgi:IQ domain-containing protein G